MSHNHVTEATTCTMSSGYDSMEPSTHPSNMIYTPPVVPPAFTANQIPHPLIPPENRFQQYGAQRLPQPDTLPIKDNTKPHSQPIQYFPHHMEQHSNVTAPLSYLHPSNFGLGPATPQGVEHEANASPYIPHSNVPVPVYLVTGSQATPNAIPVGYQFINQGQPYVYPGPVVPGTSQPDGAPPFSHQVHIPPGQGSPLLLVRAGGETPPAMQKMNRSASQPASVLQQFRSAHLMKNSTDGSGLKEHIEKEDEDHMLHRRYSSPSQMIDTQKQSVLPTMEKLKEDDSFIKETTPPRNYGGYDYIFLATEEELSDLTCPICHLIFRRPFLTDCCGAHYCYSCINDIATRGGKCPLCCRSNFKTMVNRMQERKVSALKLRCPQFENGCPWTGVLSTLPDHIDPSKGDCQYVLVFCPYNCGQEIALSSLEDHKTNHCQRRPYACKFCPYKGIYEDIPNRHWAVCEGYPIPCPNECGVNDMPRKELPNHLKICMKRRVECQFKFVGCNAVCSANDFEKHLREETHLHLALVTDLVKNLLLQQQSMNKTSMEREFEKRLETKEREINVLKHKLSSREEEMTKLKKQVSSLQEDTDDLKLEMARLKSSVSTLPYNFIVHRFNEHKRTSKQWFSQPFYTHSLGYKMSISVDCNGSDEGDRTHVSVYANLMKGEFDDDLVWPFCGTVYIRLLNQYADKDHIEHEIPFSRDVPLEISGRVLNQDLAESGLGVPQFVAHSQLQFDRHSNIGFLKSDCLHFCVSDVRVTS